MLLLLFGWFVVGTVSQSLSCDQVNTLPLSSAIIIERCIMETSDPMTTECQLLSFPLGESGNKNIVVNCGSTFSMGFSYNFIPAESTETCSYYNLTYSVNNAAFSSVDGCYSDLVKAQPLKVSTNSCGSRNSYMCYSWVTVGEGSLREPSYILIVALIAKLLFD